ncbi:MAG: methyltransferase [Pseudomonadota bacterium]
MQTSFGSFDLQRLPQRRRETLQAWDAADEFLLQHHHDQGPPATPPLLINDQFGALAVALHEQSPVSWGDSVTAHKATEINLKANHIDPKRLEMRSSLEEPVAKSDKGWEKVLIRVPRNLALLEDQLATLRPHLAPGAQITAAGMVKHLPHGAKDLLEQWIGPCDLSRAVRKARLIHCRFDPDLPISTNPWPKSFEIPEFDLKLSCHANVFAGDRLDIGARFLMEQFGRLPQAKHIVDLGCGSGVLGILARRQRPDAEMSFIDESSMAVASARVNFQTNIGDDKNARFIADYELSAHHCGSTTKQPSRTVRQIASSAVPPRDDNTGHCERSEAICQNRLEDRRAAEAAHDDTPDLILCNPPFHQGNTVSEHIGRQMIQQSKDALKPGGELWLVFNRHLDYPKLLRRLFGHTEVIAQNNKFVVTRSR